PNEIHSTKNLFSILSISARVPLNDDWTNIKSLENRIGCVRVLKHDKGRPDKQREDTTSVAWNVSATASWTFKFN
nr:WD40 domain-containing protein/LisH domain-containing protein [Tanacetum cinerariifolium]